MERKRPEVKELMLWLTDLVEWENFGEQLPGIRAPDIKRIEKDKSGIGDRKRALYNKWLQVNSNACWKDVIDALRIAEENNLAEEVKMKLEREEQGATILTTSPAEQGATISKSAQGNGYYILLNNY